MCKSEEGDLHYCQEILNAGSGREYLRGSGAGRKVMR